MKKTGAKEAKAGDSPARLIDARIKALGVGGARRSRASELSSEKPTPKWLRR
jgi:hypothetical protein